MHKEPDLRPCAPPQLRVDFRPRRARPGVSRESDALSLLFPAEAVRALIQRAGEMGRAIEWVMDAAASLRIAGSAEPCVCEIGCRDAGPGGFRVPLPMIDLVRLTQHPHDARMLVIRYADDEYWLACITMTGAVHTIRHQPTEMLRQADDLLLDIVTHHACVQADLRDRIEDYLRERHLII
jgi:hypothetical protein